MVRSSHLSLASAAIVPYFSRAGRILGQRRTTGEFSRPVVTTPGFRNVALSPVQGDQGSKPFHVGWRCSGQSYRSSTRMAKFQHGKIKTRDLARWGMVAWGVAGIVNTTERGVLTLKKKPVNLLPVIAGTFRYWECLLSGRGNWEGGMARGWGILRRSFDNRLTLVTAGPPQENADPQNTFTGIGRLAGQCILRL